MGALAWNKRPKSPIADLLHAAYARRAEAAKPGSDDDWRRDHMGASMLGHECDRYLWLSFRWALAEQKDGRMLRLLERGKREEEWLLEDLRAIGIDLVGTQLPVKWRHVGGSADAVLVNIIGSDGDPHVGEFKTSNAKQFDRLVEKGVKAAKWEHYVQMQVYMHGLSLRWALYVAVCKDDDRLHVERVPYDQKEAVAAVERGERLAILPSAPPRKLDTTSPPCVLTSKDGTQWPCKFWDLCHGDAVMPERNCRTCISATAQADGTWRCEHKAIAIDGMAQRAGCGQHVTEPSMVNAQVAGVDEAARRVTYQAAGGRVVVDGGAA